MMVDLPAPVGPTTASDTPGGMSRTTSRSEYGASSRYLKPTRSKRMSAPTREAPAGAPPTASPTALSAASPTGSSAGSDSSPLTRRTPTLACWALS